MHKLRTKEKLPKFDEIFPYAEAKNSFSQISLKIANLNHTLIHISYINIEYGYPGDFKLTMKFLRCSEAKIRKLHVRD